jgi:hypothetical protein
MHTSRVEEQFKKKCSAAHCKPVKTPCQDILQAKAPLVRSLNATHTPADL